MAVGAAKMGVAFLLALASNASLLSVLLTRNSSTSTSPPVSANVSTVTTSSSSEDYNDHVPTAAHDSDPSKSNADQLEPPSHDPFQQTHTEGQEDDGFREAVLEPMEIRDSATEDWVHEDEVTSTARPNKPQPDDVPNGKEDYEMSLDEKEMQGKDEEGAAARSARSTFQVTTPPSEWRDEPGRLRMQNILASLTVAELEQLAPNVAEILLPALKRLESVVKRELERLHEVKMRQERRLEELKNTMFKDDDVAEAVKVIREEQKRLQQKQQKEELRKQLSPSSPQVAPEQPSSVPSSNTDSHSSSELLTAEGPSGDGGSGSGDESLPFNVVAGSTMIMTTTRSPQPQTTTGTNNSAVISHIYEMYTSLTSMEHKILELDTKLASVSSEVYRQRSTIVRLDDNVEEVRRNQRNLVMRSAMHGFKLSDLMQFKGQADHLLRTAEGTIEKLDAKLEIFMDRVIEQEDEVETMQNVFTRLEQASHELNSADAFKAHDLQELRRGATHLNTRLTRVHQVLDNSLDSIRWDVKTYLENVCSDNYLDC